jgi:hypothetical protein
MGYVMVDNRASGGTLVEYDTVSCRHCQAVVKVTRGQREGFYCMHCGGPVCRHCGTLGSCTPFMKKVDDRLRRNALAKAMGLQGG